MPAVVVVAATAAADGEGKSTSMSSCWPPLPLAEGERTAGWSSKCGNSPLPLPDPVTAGESETGDLTGDSFNSSSSEDYYSPHYHTRQECHQASTIITTIITQANEVNTEEV